MANLRVYSLVVSNAGNRLDKAHFPVPDVIYTNVQGNARTEVFEKVYMACSRAVDAAELEVSVSVLTGGQDERDDEGQISHEPELRGEVGSV